MYHTGPTEFILIHNIYAFILLWKHSVGNLESHCNITQPNMYLTRLPQLSRSVKLLFPSKVGLHKGGGLLGPNENIFPKLQYSSTFEIVG